MSPHPPYGKTGIKYSECQPLSFLSTRVRETGLEMDRAHLLFWTCETEKRRKGKSWKRSHGWGPYKLKSGN